MRRLCIVPLLLLAACTEQPRPEDIAGAAAKTYYEMLSRGEYDFFVDGTYRPDSLPDSYREQLVAAARMYVGEIQEAHRGIRQVRLEKATADTARRTGEAYLVFAYGDSTTEETVVPMVYHEGVWYMR